VWDIWRQKDVTLLTRFLSDRASEFTHMGVPAAGGAPAAAAPADGGDDDDFCCSGCSSMPDGSRCIARLDPVFSQRFMLAERHRQELKADTGVEGWHFEQLLNEAVFIPSGCPHQVRNLMSCTKVRLVRMEPAATRSSVPLRAMCCSGASRHAIHPRL
jgi:hypothetical protein